MPMCGSDPSHHVSEWFRRNEMGRWYECEDCGSTVLSPGPRYMLVILWMRLQRRVDGALQHVPRYRRLARHRLRRN